MARGRMLNTTIAKDKQLNDLSIEAEYIYLKAIPHLDRDGLINGDPALLWSDVCPRRKELMPRMQGVIDEIVASGLVIAYECENDGDPVLFFRGFSKNQGGMRYDRESPSRFSTPPGYLRTATGLVLASTAANAQTTDSNNPDASGNAGQSERGNPDQLRTYSGLSPTQYKDQDQVQDKGEDHAHATPAAAANNSPPLVPKANEYLPGLPDPRKRQGQQCTVAEHIIEAKALGLTEESYRQVVDALLVGFGKKSLVDAGDDETLNFVQGLAITVMRISERFRTPAGIKSIFDSWAANDWRGKDSLPTSTQFKEHAGKMADGKVGTTVTQPPQSQASLYKAWKLRKYQTDNALAIGIPESQLRAEYEQSTRVH